nr:hypothetical protein [Rhizobium sp. CC-CFT758]
MGIRKVLPTGIPTLLAAAGIFMSGAVAPVLAQDAIQSDAVQNQEAATSDTYRLGVMDKLRIRVAEWQPADGSIRDWDVVSGDYTVGPSGALSCRSLVIWMQQAKRRQKSARR